MTPRIKIEVITLFPEYFDSMLRASVLGKARDKKLFEIEIVDLRRFTTDKHQTADDAPYGGGGGMVLMIEPLYECLKSLGYEKKARPGEKIVLTSAAGRRFTQEIAVACSLLKRLTIICGHYLGVDERLMEMFEIEEVSIGDYVLTGGEAAAGVMIDAVTRLIPGVLGNFESATADSHTERLLGSPAYTRPEEFMGRKVPEELLSGNHARIEEYRRKESIRKTYENRPEILDEIELNEDDVKYIEMLKKGKND